MIVADADDDADEDYADYDDDDAGDDDGGERVLNSIVVVEYWASLCPLWKLFVIYDFLWRF